MKCLFSPHLKCFINLHSRQAGTKGSENVGNLAYRLFSLNENVRESSTASHEIFRSVERVSIPLYAQETTTAHLRRHPCFPDRSVILNEDSLYFQTIRKRDFAEILENFLTARLLGI